MLFGIIGIPYLADWKAVGQRQKLLVVYQNSTRENARRINYDYCTGHEGMLRKEGTICKVVDRYEGTYVVTQEHTNITMQYRFNTEHGRND